MRKYKIPPNFTLSGHAGVVRFLQKKKKEKDDFLLFCDPDRIQTCNLLIRSQMLYSVELRDRFVVVVV